MFTIRGNDSERQASTWSAEWISTCMGGTMSTGRERMAATRARRRRGLSKLSVEVHEDELRAIALKGYEGAATTDRGSRPRRSLFSSPTTRTRRSEKAHGRGFCCASQTAPLRITVARHIPGCASHFATRRPAKPLKPAEQQGRRLLNGRQCPFSTPDFDLLARLMTTAPHPLAFAENFPSRPSSQRDRLGIGLQEDFRTFVAHQTPGLLVP